MSSKSLLDINDDSQANLAAYNATATYPLLTCLRRKFVIAVD